MTKDDAAVVGEFIGDAIAEAIKPLQEQIHAQHEVIQGLLSREMKDAGVWQSGRTYPVGSVVTRGGSAWICSSVHTAGADMDHDAFRLLVKCGRDGKDAR